MPLTHEEREDRQKIYRRRWYEKNKVAILARQSAYQKANRDKTRAAQARYVARHPEKVRAHYRRKNWQVQGCPEPTRPEPAVCECCGKANSDGRALSLDHCHISGVFRGWLCGACNLGLGKLGDTVESVQRALDYLKRSQQ